MQTNVSGPTYIHALSLLIIRLLKILFWDGKVDILEKKIDPSGLAEETLVVSITYSTRESRNVFWCLLKMLSVASKLGKPESQ